jgi:hypothetical protein
LKTDYGLISGLKTSQHVAGNNVMPCKLCGEANKLIEAHIIPRSFYRIDPGRKHPGLLITDKKGRYAQTVPKGVYDASILCEHCERRFSRWDDYGNELLIKSWHKFEKIEDRGEHLAYRLDGYDYSLLKMFVLSVLWRASVSGHVMFDRIDLGTRELSLRNAILLSDPGDSDHFGVVLQAFDSAEVGMLNPHGERFSGLRFCRLYLSHVIAFIKVDSRPFKDPFRSLALSPARPLVVLQKEFLSSPERAIMRNLVIAHERKKRLTK